MAASAPCLFAGCSPPSQGVVGARFSASQPERSEGGPNGGSSDPPARGRERPLSCSARLPRWAAVRALPRAARDLLFAAYLGQTLVQTLHLAQHEYIEAYDTDAWRDTIRESHEQSANHTSPDPDTGDDPSPTPEQEPAPAPTSAAPSDASPASK